VTQAEYERQSEMEESARQRSLVQCREEMMRMIGASDVSAVPVNEQWIRQKYAKETQQIKVKINFSATTGAFGEILVSRPKKTVLVLS